MKKIKNYCSKLKIKSKKYSKEYLTNYNIYHHLKLKLEFLKVLKMNNIKKILLNIIKFNKNIMNYL